MGIHASANSVEKSIEPVNKPVEEFRVSKIDGIRDTRKRWCGLRPPLRMRKKEIQVFVRVYVCVCVCACGPCARISVVRVRRGAIYSEMTGGVTVPRSILAVFSILL